MYQDACQDARDWLNVAQDKLVSCADVRGDRHSLEAKREKTEVRAKLFFHSICEFSDHVFALLFVCICAFFYFENKVSCSFENV